jgi:hypothetical protein
MTLSRECGSEMTATVGSGCKRGQGGEGVRPIRPIRGGVSQQHPYFARVKPPPPLMRRQAPTPWLRNQPVVSMFAIWAYSLLGMSDYNTAPMVR